MGLEEMRSISDALLEAQKTGTPRKPLVKLEVQAYGHPAAIAEGDIQWESFAWQRFYQGGEVKDSHGVTIPGDGSLIRIRKDGTNCYVSRVTSPGPLSTYSSWGSSFGGVPAVSKVAIASQGAEVMVVAMDAANLYRRQSSDYGATWGSWTIMSNARPCERGVAIAYKSNGDCMIVHASDINDPTSLYIQKRTGGTWSTGLGQRSGDWEIADLAMYYDGDWNIIALVQEGSYLSVVRMVYGDGYKVTAGTWADDAKIGLGRARVDVAAQVRLRLFEVGWPVGFRRMQPFGPWEPRTASTYWERYHAVLAALAGETLDVSGPYLVKPPTSCARPLLSLARQNQPWLYRLKPGTDFIDYNWNKASFIDTSASRGMALAADPSGGYIWATQPNEVWRAACVGSWSPPTPGSGAGTKITIPVAKIARIAEAMDPEQPSELVVELDNAKGTYNSPGSGSLAVLQRGARVNLHLGYKTTSGDQLSEAARYFIEAMEYKRDPNLSAFIMHCVDAWGLLTRYQFNKPVEWNSGSDDFTCYQLIEKVVQAVGGTLDYKSRSSLITSLYPRLEVGAGESAAGVLKRLLRMVPDVIYFFGLEGFIAYPQSGDTVVYKFRFPQ
ncbi:MAG: hypothetical protein A2Y72_03665 [Chloroflexi bacterium RBG_13_53_26]|nr:MAG: hypothetical protein A2Y72_03665 [Chloroflexi bacterium RBG_13_53_26]